MNLLQSSKNALKTLVIVVTTCLFFFSPVAIASTDTNDVMDTVFKEISITKSDFQYSHQKIIPTSGRVSSAIVSLPEGESGTIDNIKIIGPNNELEFGCVNQNVVNGTDLIKSCGGNAYLKEGNTTYEANGSNFTPGITLGIDLKV